MRKLTIPSDQPNASDHEAMKTSPDRPNKAGFPKKSTQTVATKKAKKRPRVKTHFAMRSQKKSKRSAQNNSNELQGKPMGGKSTAIADSEHQGDSETEPSLDESNNSPVRTASQCSENSADGRSTPIFNNRNRPKRNLKKLERFQIEDSVPAKKKKPEKFGGGSSLTIPLHQNSAGKSNLPVPHRDPTGTSQNSAGKSNVSWGSKRSLPPVRLVSANGEAIPSQCGQRDANGRTTYLCDRCPHKPLTSISDFVDHYKGHGATHLPQKCPICDYCCTASSAIHKHITMHKNAPSRSSEGFSGRAAAQAAQGEILPVETAETSKEQPEPKVHEALRIVVSKVQPEPQSDDQSISSPLGDATSPSAKIGPHNDVEVTEGFTENPDGTISITISPRYVKTINLSASNGIVIPKNCVKRFEKSGVWLVCDKCPVRKPVHRLEIFAKHYAGHGSNARMRCKICDFSCNHILALRRHEISHLPREKQMQIQNLSGGRKRKFPQTGAKFGMHPASMVKMGENSLNFLPSLKKVRMMSAAKVDAPRVSLAEVAHCKRKNSGRYDCDRCPMRNCRLEYFILHYAGHGAHLKYECHLCDYSSARGSGLQKHLSMHSKLISGPGGIGISNSFSPSTIVGAKDSLESKFQCVRCQFATADPETYHAHLKLHLVGQGPPNVILSTEFARVQPKKPQFPSSSAQIGIGGGKTFWKPSKLKKCPYCPYKAVNNMDRHKKMHFSQRLHKCPYCSFSTDVLNALNYHKRLHGESESLQIPSDFKQQKFSENAQNSSNVAGKPKPLRCSDCPFQTFHEGTYQSHLKCHNADPPGSFTCDLCTFSTSLPFLINTHKKMHEKAATEVSEGGSSKSSSISGDAAAATNPSNFDLKPANHLQMLAKIFNCTKCPYETNRRGDLSKHMLNHGRDAPFKCAHCDYGMISQHALQVHSYLHTGKGGPAIGRNSATFSNGMRSKEKFRLARRRGFAYFDCKRCLFQTVNHRSMFNHVKQHRRPDSKQFRFKCKRCEFGAKSAQSLRIHRADHPEFQISKFKKKFPNFCANCKFRFGFLSQFKIHRILRHPYSLEFPRITRPIRKFSPSIQFRKVEQIEPHAFFIGGANGNFGIAASGANNRSRDPNKMRRCPFCMYLSAYVTDMKSIYRHMLHHEIPAEFKCSMCTFSTVSKFSLTRHERMHENEAGALLVPVFGSDDVPSLPVVENSAIAAKMGIAKRSPSADDECTCTGEFANLDWQPKAVNKSNIRRRRHVQPCYGPDGSLIGYRFKFQGRRTIRCLYCPTMDPELQKMTAHYAAHNALKISADSFSCGDCKAGFVTDSVTDFRQHEAWHDFGRRQRIMSELDERLRSPISSEGSVHLCNLCPFESTSIETLTAHVKFHNLAGIYCCPIFECSFSANDIETLKVHVAGHSIPESYNSDISRSPVDEFEIFPAIANGIEIPPISASTSASVSASATKLICQICGFEAKSYSALWCHKKAHDRGSTGDDQPQYRCPQCPFNTTSQSSWWHHSQMHQKSGGMFRCDKCSFSTQMSNVYHSHMKLHHVQSGTGNVQSGSGNVQSGSGSIQSGSGSVQSRGGNVQFGSGNVQFGSGNVQSGSGSIQSLLLHPRKQSKTMLSLKPPPLIPKPAAAMPAQPHSATHVQPQKPVGSPPRPVPIVKEPKLEDRMKCSLCPYVAADEQLKQIHDKLHLGKREFSCDSCSFSCSQWKTLESHAKLHGKTLRRFEGHLPNADDDLPSSKRHRNFNAAANQTRLAAKECYKYYCPKCSFSCSQVASFLKHTAMHGRRADAPFMCNICDYSSSRLGNIKFHELNHHAHVPLTALIADESGKFYRSDLAKSNEAANSSRSGADGSKSGVGCVLPSLSVTVKCVFCEFRTSDPNALATHAESHVNLIIDDAKAKVDPVKHSLLNSLNLGLVTSKNV